MSAPRALASAMILLRGVEQVRLAQRLADAVAHRGDEGVGDAAADDQLVDLADQVVQQCQLGRDLGAGDDRQQRARRLLQRLAQRVELGHQQRAGRGDRGEPDHAVGGGLGAVRGAERVHHEDVAQRGVLLRQRLVVLALADVHAAVLQQHHLARRDLDAVDQVVAPPAAPRWPSLLISHSGHRRQRVDFAPTGLPSAGPGATSPSPPRPAPAPARIVGRAASRRWSEVIVAVLVDRHVQILADQHALAGAGRGRSCG